MHYRHLIFAVLAIIGLPFSIVSSTSAADTWSNRRIEAADARYYNNYNNRLYDGSYSYRSPGRYSSNWSSNYFDYRRNYNPYGYSYGNSYGYDYPYSNYYNPYYGNYSYWY